MGVMKGGVRKTWREEIAHNCLRHSLSLETDSAPNVPINIQCATEARGEKIRTYNFKKTAVILFPCQGPRNAIWRNVRQQGFTCPRGNNRRFFGFVTARRKMSMKD